jgi:alanine racemase
MAMVKANAYGHGDLQVATAALEAGAQHLGVALVEEGFGLRAAGVMAPILVIAEVPPGAEEVALAAGLTPTVYSAAAIARLGAARRLLDLHTTVHLKVDTGTHRLGASPEDAATLARQIADAGLVLEGLWTHFANSEDPEDPFTQTQLTSLLKVAASLRAEGIGPRIVHAANTAAIVTRPETHLDLVRLGIGMYGVDPVADPARQLPLRPAMTWRSAVVLAKRVRAGEGISYGLRYRLERESMIATIPVGYADGYSRLLSHRGAVLVRGRRRSIAGAVTMDQVMVDCGDDEVAAGDEVVLIGRQDEEEITARQLADWTGSIPDEILCSVGARVPREYLRA